MEKKREWVSCSTEDHTREQLVCACQCQSLQTLSSWEPQLDCLINHLLLYSQLQNISAAALAIAQREKKLKNFSCILSITGVFTKKKKKAKAFSFGPLLYLRSVSEVFSLSRRKAEAVSSLQTPESGFGFTNFKVVFLYTFQYWFLFQIAWSNSIDFAAMLSSAEKFKNISHSCLPRRPQSQSKLQEKPGIS